MLGQQPQDEAIIHGVKKKKERHRTKGNTNFRFGKKESGKVNGNYYGERE